MTHTPLKYLDKENNMTDSLRDQGTRMKPHYDDGEVTLYLGDCLAVLSTLPDESIDAVVTDPPYGLSNTDPKHVAETLTKWVTGDHEYTPPAKGGFMGKTWDSFVPPPAVWVECMRVLKPGGHLLVFAGTRTQDLMGMSIRLAGFEIRDGIGWIYGSGFPKSMNVSKAIDKAAGALAHESVGFTVAGRTDKNLPNPVVKGYTPPAPATPDAERWQGWGTALKPAIEPVIVARKPIKGTVAANVLEYGTGGINVDACRVEAGDLEELQKNWDRTQSANQGIASTGLAQIDLSDRKPDGRWPANVLLDPEAAAAMDEQSGTGTSRKGKPRKSKTPGEGYGMTHTGAEYDDSGGASRFFSVFKYQAKAPKRERPVIEREDGTKVVHPTVKPLALMEWLVTLVTPPGGVVLDPFAGSGTTLQAARDKGFRSIGIEADADYVELIRARLSEPTDASE